QGELEGTVSKTSALGRHVLSMVPALRATYVLRERYELGARLGFGYDIYDGGDSSYTIISQDVVRGQIAEVGEGGARFSTVLGLSLGYRITSAIRTSIRYNGRYSADLGNSSFGLEGSFKF
ncbi:MAG: hypothetical protein LBU15_01020, partial [Rickettsiales bacterium]|nr:hypothetical protein [Rickettsiales bacterium]